LLDGLVALQYLIVVGEVVEEGLLFSVAVDLQLRAITFYAD